MEVLLKHGANADVSDKWDNSAYELAAQFGDECKRKGLGSAYDLCNLLDEFLRDKVRLHYSRKHE